MYERLLPEVDRRISPRSVTAGFVLNAAMFAILVAASYPLTTGVVIATGAVLYALGGVIRRSDFERTLQFCRGEVCFRLQVSVG